MDQSGLIVIGALAIAALCVVIVIYMVVAPYTTGAKRVQKRLMSVTAGPSLSSSKLPDSINSRRKQVADTLRDIEAKQSTQKSVPLRQKLQQAGLDASPQSFWIASAVCGVVFAGLILILSPNVPFLAAIGFGVAGALGFPRFVLGKLIKRRQAKFLLEFANSIDIIVRGVKSGLPLVECLKIIGNEAPDPVGVEFREVCDQQRIGIPLQQCFERMMDRVPLQEVRFFAIVVGIQQSAGGNLSEALGNLSGVLRDRKTMAAKVQALSAEAKASAAVLGSLPIIVMLLVYFTTPEYIALLWQKTHGNFMLLGSGIWMTCGLLVMKKMINFKF